MIFWMKKYVSIYNLIQSDQFYLYNLVQSDQFLLNVVYSEFISSKQLSWMKYVN